MLEGRTVTNIEDEVFDSELLQDSDTLHGEGALLAALNKKRTGRMNDIVATIQAEQDAIIRSELPGVRVVQGGPGTGKTAVALHRAAYLLYTNRERLAKAGVLVVGPSHSFMWYIERVLPSLGKPEWLWHPWQHCTLGFALYQSTIVVSLRLRVICAW